MADGQDHKLPDPRETVPAVKMAGCDAIAPEIRAGCAIRQCPHYICDSQSLLPGMPFTSDSRKNRPLSCLHGQRSTDEKKIGPSATLCRVADLRPLG